MSQMQNHCIYQDIKNYNAQPKYVVLRPIKTNKINAFNFYSIYFINKGN